MHYGMTASIDRTFDDTLERTRQALADNGFGIVSEINIQQTLKNKLDVDIPPQVILGACAPQFAYRSLQAEPSIGLLLPCNVVVRAEGASTVVEAVDPAMLVEVTGNDSMRGIADEVRSRLAAALDSLRGTG